MIWPRPFGLHQSFSDPRQIVSVEGKGKMPFGVFRYEQIIDECYMISKVIHTSYNDILNISIRERDRMIELINEENERNKKDLEKMKHKQRK